MIGIAISNPSSAADLFANDEFPFASGNGVEYDTVALAMSPVAVPEPGAVSFVLIATILSGIRRSRRPIDCGGWGQSRRYSARTPSILRSARPMNPTLQIKVPSNIRPES